MSSIHVEPIALSVLWSTHVHDYASAIDVSRDGSLVAVGTGGGDVHVFDLQSGVLRWRNAAHPGGVLAVAWSAKSRTLATAGHDARVRLHDANGGELGRVEGADWIGHLAWSPDGARLAVASGRVVRVWRDGVVRETEEHESTVTGLAWSRRGTELATACDDSVRFFAPDARTPSRRLHWRGSLISLRWSPDDAVIAGGTTENSVHFWRLTTGRDAEMAGFLARPRALAWDNASTLLATSGDAKVAVWKFDGKGPEGRRPILLAGHAALCTVVAFHPKRPQLASGADDAQVILWDPATRTTPLAAGPLEDTVTGLVWAPEGGILVGVDARGTARAWSVE